MESGWFVRQLRHAAFSALHQLPAWLTIASATLVLLARFNRVPFLDPVLCQVGPMRANAAAGFLLAGLSLALSRRAGAHRASAGIGEACGAAVALLGTVTIAESIAAADWGVDRLLYFRPLDCDGRMPAITALAFVLIGLALALRHGSRALRTSAVLASATALLTSVPLLGFLYGASTAQVGGRLAAMTPADAATLTLLSAGFLLTSPALRRSTPLFGSNPQSAALRRLLLATFVWPATGGLALVAGVRGGLYDVALGTAALVTLGFAMFTILILHNARDLDRLRRAREEAELQYHDLVEFMPDGILSVDRRGRIRTANARAEQLFGYSRPELCGQLIETLLPSSASPSSCSPTPNRPHLAAPTSSRYTSLASVRPISRASCWPSVGSRSRGLSSWT